MQILGAEIFIAEAYLNGKPQVINVSATTKMRFRRKPEIKKGHPWPDLSILGRPLPDGQNLFFSWSYCVLI